MGCCTREKKTFGKKNVCMSSSSSNVIPERVFQAVLQPNYTIPFAPLPVAFGHRHGQVLRAHHAPALRLGVDRHPHEIARRAGPAIQHLQEHGAEGVDHVAQTVLSVA